jgi:hypothetical protein
MFERTINLYIKIIVDSVMLVKGHIREVFASVESSCSASNLAEQHFSYCNGFKHRFNTLVVENNSLAQY